MTSSTQARALGRAAESIHCVGYYTPEIRRMTDYGFNGWWHSYFGYRFAPLGRPSLNLVVATAYNFAPRMVAKAIPSAWDILAPDELLVAHRALVSEALNRIFAEGFLAVEIAEAAELAKAAVGDLPLPGRPLFAAHAELAWPTGPLMTLWHACTLLREYRFDGHNMALAGAGIDGVECHVLMAAFGHGNQATIGGIRGWTEDEWDGAVERLMARGWIDAGCEFTPEGREARAGVERATDQLAVESVVRLGSDDADRLAELLRTIAGHLIQSGEVAGVWPPPAVLLP